MLPLPVAILGSMAAVLASAGPDAPDPPGPIPVRIETNGAVLAGDVFLPRQAAAGRVPGVVMVHGSGRFERETTLRQLARPTLWIMGDRDGNLPLPETLRALEALPARNSGLLTLVRFAEADHEMCRPDGSRVDFWKTIEGWLVARGILQRGATGEGPDTGHDHGRAEDRR